MRPLGEMELQYTRLQIVFEVEMILNIEEEIVVSGKSIKRLWSKEFQPRSPPSNKMVVAMSSTYFDLKKKIHWDDDCHLGHFLLGIASVKLQMISLTMKDEGKSGCFDFWSSTTPPKSDEVTSMGVAVWEMPTNDRSWCVPSIHLLWERKYCLVISPSVESETTP
jgi:hypothetical protein